MVSQHLSHSRVREAVDRLKGEFQGVAEAETIARLVSESFESFSGARIPDFVPLLVYKSTRDHLLKLSSSQRLEHISLVAG